MSSASPDKAAAVSNAITCADCGSRLEQIAEDESGSRLPCPDCGSTRRNYTLYAEPGHFGLVGHPVDLIVSNRLPPVLLQAVIVPAGKTPEGTLIQGVAPARFEIIRLLRADPEILFKIDPRKMEELIAGAYQKAGFEEVVLTPRSGDFGRDVIAVKRGIGTVRVIDQVKAYKPGHRVAADDVRALMGVLHTDGAAKGFLTTTSDFAPGIHTDPLITPLIPSRLELVNGAALSTRLQELAR